MGVTDLINSRRKRRPTSTRRIIIAIAPQGRTATNGGRPCGVGIAGASPVSSKTNPVVRVGHGLSNESTKGYDTKAGYYG